jgi:hypothetical protein
VEIEVQRRSKKTQPKSRPSVAYSGTRPANEFMVQWGLVRAKEIGSRNRAAFDLGQQLNDNRFPKEEAWEVGLAYLERVNEELPNGHALLESEVRAAFRDAYALERREPWRRRGDPEAAFTQSASRRSSDAGWSA